MKSGSRALFGQLLKLKTPRSPPTPDPSTLSAAGERNVLAKWCKAVRSIFKRKGRVFCFMESAFAEIHRICSV
jgi:hypothetical protein